MKKIFFLLLPMLLLLGVRNPAHSNTRALTEQSVQTFTTESDMASEMNMPKDGFWKRFKAWLVYTILDILGFEPYWTDRINSTPNGGNMPGQVKIDYAAFNRIEAEGLGISVDANSISFSQEVLVEETEMKMLFIAPGNYMFREQEGESVADITYVVRDK